MDGLSGIAVKILLKNLAKTRTYLYWLLCGCAVCSHCLAVTPAVAGWILAAEWMYAQREGDRRVL